MTGAEGPALVLDIGGTKTLVALVDGVEVLAEARIPTSPGAGPDAWIEAAAAAAAPWSRRFGRVAAAVTGLVAKGRWSALNPATLPIPEGFPLVERLERRFGRPALAVNDAQAAAWGEHRWGAGQGGDMAFLTLSTGIGGGLVLGGRLVTGRGGLAGHFGITGMILTEDPAPIESRISGRWVAAEAARAGHEAQAEEVFAAACEGVAWAEAIVAEQAARTARLLRNLQLILAPERIVLGGGIGLAPGHLERIRARLSALPPVLRPHLVPAALGARAGVVGAADLARSRAKNDNQQGRSA